MVGVSPRVKVPSEGVSFDLVQPFRLAMWDNLALEE